MADRLSGRTIVVTGGASGIGAALATGFAAEGANVVIADLNVEAADALVAQIRSTGGSANAVRVDVTDRASVAAGIARRGRGVRPPRRLLQQRRHERRR